MSAIVVYGSLLNKEQLATITPHVGESTPVLVRGYQRIFNQEPSWRQGRGVHRAVLNARSSKNDLFNGLLVPLLDNDLLQSLDERERGYDRISLDDSCLTRHPDYSIPSRISTVFMYTGKIDRQSNDLLPNEDYLNLCLDGARQWGEKFLELFLQTTYVGEATLESYLRGKV